MQEKSWTAFFQKLPALLVSTNHVESYSVDSIDYKLKGATEPKCSPEAETLRDSLKLYRDLRHLIRCS